MKVIVIGAKGFVGSAFVAWLSECPNVEVVEVTRLNYAQMVGTQSDVVIDASCNSKKYLAEERPLEEFELSVQHRLRTLQDFPAATQVHISSVDVYSDLSTQETTREDSPIDLQRVSHYGLHKLLAEQLVQHYADKWLIIRLAGMVGAGLRKNPVYDILQNQPLRIHPDSQYQFMATRDVASIVWTLVESKVDGEIFNVCGKELISPREIAAMTGRVLNLSLLDSTAQPRIVHVSTEKIESAMPLPQTSQSIADFIRDNAKDQAEVRAWAEIKVSVIIPTHNRPDKLAETVAGLRHQTLPATEYEILVMDDGSTPPVVLMGELENPVCRVIRLEGVERSAARNIGATTAQGRILLFLDDDIGVNGDFLAAHLRAHEEWPGALVVGAIHLPAEILKTPFGRFRQNLELSGLPKERGLVAMRNFCTAANMSIDRELYFELGGFNCALHSSEDQELALRHTARGGQIVFIPEANTVHYDHSLDIQSYCRRVEWGGENMVPFCQSQPNWLHNIERQRINGSLRFGQEPFGLSLRKIAKSILSQSLFLKGLFQLAFLFEQMAPQGTALDRLYRLLLGIHLQRGYRKGLKKHESKTKLSISSPRGPLTMPSGNILFQQLGKSVIKPNLFIVGAPKCGTTSMSDYLSQHPDVFMSAIKEPHFFGSDLRYNPGYIRNEEEYLSLFAKAQGKKIAGEASTWYLFSNQAAREIKDFSPDARIIIMLRNPVDMIYSLHGQRLYDCNEDIVDFAEALAAETDRRQGLRRPKAFQGSLDVYLYTEVGKYARQVQRYLNVFGRERVHFITFDDLMNDTEAVFRQTCDFLGIDSTVQMDFKVKNQMKKLRLPVLGRFMQIPPKLAQVIFRTVAPHSWRRKLYDSIWNMNVTVEKRPSLKPETVSLLADEFASDVQQLSNLLGRDLTHWITRRSA